MANIFEELGEESRRRILYCLVEGPKNVGEIVDEAGLRQPNVSNHLGRLRAKGIVSSRKIGREVFYALGSTEISEAVRMAVNSRSHDPIEINHEACVKEYARHSVQGDKAQCQQVVQRYLHANIPIAEIYHSLLCPAMELIGVWYQVDAIDEGQEHLATSITDRIMAQISASFPALKRTEYVALLGCAPENWHHLGLRMACDILRNSGWTTYFLGPNVPEKSFLSAIKRHKPNLVLLSACATGTEERVQKLISEIVELRNQSKPFTVGAGGILIRQDPQRYLEKGLDFWARDIKEFSNIILPTFERQGFYKI